MYSCCQKYFLFFKHILGEREKCQKDRIFLLPHFLKNKIQVDTQNYLEAIENPRISICCARIFHSAMFSTQPFSKQMNLPSPELSGEPALLMGYELGFREMGLQFYTKLCKNSAALNTFCPGFSWGRILIFF